MFEFLDTSGLIYADLVNCAVASLLAVFLLIFCIDDKYKIIKKEIKKRKKKEIKEKRKKKEKDKMKTRKSSL